jgi:hypothetical protein
MLMHRKLRFSALLVATGIVALASVVILPARKYLEADMFMHMLFQLPLFLLVGVLMHLSAGAQRLSPLSSPSPYQRLQLCRLNQYGLCGFTFAAFTLAFWMIPVALDRSLDDAYWNVAKYASIMMAGYAISASYGVAPKSVKLFFVGNMVWMLGVVGLLYQDETTRLCLSYLVDSQKQTGRGMVIVTVGIGLSGAIYLFRAKSVVEPSDAP